MTNMNAVLQLRPKPLLPNMSPAEPKDNTTSGAGAQGDVSSTLATRAYQTEMYEKSVKGNIVVVVSVSPACAGATGPSPRHRADET